MNRILFGDNLPILRSTGSESIDLIYIDPPFNTGRRQERRRIEIAKDPENGDRRGFSGEFYQTIEADTFGFDDVFDDYLSFLAPRLVEAHRLLAPDGSFFFHIDYREVHYCKVLLDQIFGRDSFVNEIIWAYDYGGRSKSRWPTKHDNILWYAKDPSNYTFNYKDMDRIPYMAPSLVTDDKAARGKTPTDVWWHTIVPTSGGEKTGYATQKPLGVVERIVKIHSNPGDVLMDFFAGSGTLGEAAAKNKRTYILIDNNEEAIRVMAKRLAKSRPRFLDADNRPLNDPGRKLTQELLLQLD